jgi:hypothetical protein
MLCYACGEPAMSQCQNCGLFYCANHGRVYCAGCKALEQIAPGPPRDSGPTGGTMAIRPSSAEPAAPLGRCYACGTPSDRVCRLCGAVFCGEHRGWRPVPIGRYTMRQIVCARCAGPPSQLSVQMMLLIAGALILLALAVFLLIACS